MTNKINYSFANFGPFLFKSKLPNNLIEELLEEGIRTKEKYNHQLAGHLDNQYVYPQDFQAKFYEKFSPYLSAYREGHCQYHNLLPLYFFLLYASIFV